MKSLAIKEQFKTIKNNWLIIIIAIVLLAAVFLVRPSSFAKVDFGAERSYGQNLESVREGGYAYSPEPSLSASAPRAAAKSGATLAEEDRKITTTANINTKVEQGEFLPAEQKLKSISSATNSLILQENVRRFGEDKKAYYTGTYTIKVESSKLDAVTAQLKEIGVVESFIERKDDITESYQKLEIEIATEKQRLTRYQKILDDAKIVEDKIKLNDYIFAQERRIQYLEDSLKNADKQVDYSTIYVQITEKEPAFADIKWIDGSELLVGLVNNTAAVIYLVVVLFPYAIATILIWLAIRWVRGKSSKKK